MPCWEGGSPFVGPMTRRRVCKPWSSAEDEIVRKGYPNYVSLRRSLPHRSLSALKYRASVLGLQTRRHRWTGREMKNLERLRAGGATWPQIQEMYPGRSLGRAMNYHKKRRGPVRLGFPLLDDIRQRAFDRGIRLRELDEFACSGTYFRRGNRFENIRHVQQAAKLLGGELMIEWPTD